MATEAQIRAAFAAAGVDPSQHLDGSTEDASTRIARLAASGRSLADINQSITRIASQPVRTGNNPGALPGSSGSSVSSSDLAAMRAELGLPVDSESDQVWQRRIAAGGATLDDALRAMQAKYADWSQGNPYTSGDQQFHAPEGWSGAAQEEEAALNYREYAPGWLSGALLDTFVEHWSKTGDPNLAMAAVRRSSEYDRRFPGNRREDGSLRHDEQTYMSTREAFRRTTAEYGLGGLTDQQVVGLFEGEVTSREFAQAAEVGYQTFSEPGSPMERDLAQAYVDGFIRSKSAIEAMESVRGSSAYDRVFAGNRREDGSLRMSEQEYYGYTRAWDRELSLWGLNPDLFRARGKLLESIQNEISVEELAGRLATTSDAIVNNIDEVREFYAQGYGIQLSNEAILGMAVDPDLGREVFERRISAAQIGGEAALQGFRRSMQQAEKLARAGLGQREARDLYSQASRAVPALDAMAARYYDPQGGFGIEGYESAQVLGDQRVMQRMERRLAEEQSAFSTQANVRADREGALTGLRQR